VQGVAEQILAEDEARRQEELVSRLAAFGFPSTSAIRQAWPTRPSNGR
jgi:hypothetical protein